jgi:tetratricopeptide (TPR) repeat protein
MDSLISAAARALAAGDPLSALKRVALRSDPPALALRGIAMAQLGDLARARDLLRSAARGFGSHETVPRARCVVAEAEIALVLRDIARPTRTLSAARETLAAHGDRANAAHAGYLEARRLLLIGRLDEAERALERVEESVLPLASRPGYWLVVAGIAMRRIRAAAARDAVERAQQAAQAAGIPALVAEADRASRTLEAPSAALMVGDGRQLINLAEVEALIASGALVVDACRTCVRAGPITVPLAGRSVLFALVRALAEAWPEDVPRQGLVERAFRARDADESHRARLRVEMGRLRRELAPLAGVDATRRGFILHPQRVRTVAVLAPPVE